MFPLLPQSPGFLLADTRRRRGTRWTTTHLTAIGDIILGTIGSMSKFPQGMSRLEYQVHPSSEDGNMLTLHGKLQKGKASLWGQKSSFCTGGHRGTCWGSNKPSGTRMKFPRLSWWVSNNGKSEDRNIFNNWFSYFCGSSLMRWHIYLTHITPTTWLQGWLQVNFREDCCKEFDIPLYNMLIKKLAVYNINKPHVNWIKRWLTDLNK